MRDFLLFVSLFASIFGLSICSVAAVYPPESVSPQTVAIALLFFTVNTAALTGALDCLSWPTRTSRTSPSPELARRSPMTDDPTWDAAASDRFNATFDLLSTFRRLLVAHGEPVMLDLPPDLDPTLRDALIAEGRTNPSVIVVDHRNLAPRTMEIVGDNGPASFRDALRRIEAALDHLPPMEPPVLDIPTDTVATLTRPPALPRVTKAPKPPDDIQAAIMAKAEARRERVRARNLKNLEQR